MALFGKKTEEKKAATPAVVKTQKTTPQASSTTTDTSHVLRHARITEKATMQQGMSVYTFDVSERATKREIIAAVRSLYNVTPRKVAVVTVPSKMRRSMKTGQRGMSRGGRKAYVYLKAGETITIS